MASAPLAIGTSPVSVTHNSEAGNPAPTEINSANQSDKITFPQVMKQVKGGADGKGDKDTKNDAKKDDGSTTVLTAPQLQTADAALPFPGIQLPHSLVQGGVPAAVSASDASTAGPAPDRNDVITLGDQSASASANGGLAGLIALQGGGKDGEGKGGDGKGAQQTAQPVSDNKAASLLQSAQQMGSDAAAKTSAASPAIAADPSPFNAKSDFSALIPALHGNQQTTQTLSQNLAGAVVLDKHSGQSDTSSHMGLDAAGLNALTQGTDKLHQTQMSPPAISVPMRTPQWGDELSNRVMWMVQHDVQTASIKINPPHLGPLEVQVSMNKDHVDVSFNSHHAEVKEALDASMPKLKEMLGSSGLQLGNANVSHHSFSGHSQYNNQGSGQQYPGGDGHNIDTTLSDSEEIVSPAIYNWDTGAGAIDFYA
jgi:flagellar hook-length control protein FliK